MCFSNGYVLGFVF